MLLLFMCLFVFFLRIEDAVVYKDVKLLESTCNRINDKIENHFSLLIAANEIDKNQLEFLQSMKSVDLIPGPKSLIVIGPDGVCQYDYSNPSKLRKLSCIQVSNPIEVS